MSASHVLVTGGGGFAGRHLVYACLAAGDDVVITTRSRRDDLPPEAEQLELDLLDRSAVETEVERTTPTTIYHLAALASVGKSWEQPEQTLRENIAMTLNLLESTRLKAPTAAVLVAGSGEIYGIPEELPVTEQAPVRPRSPYGVAKASIDLLAGFYADVHDLRVIRTRSFNHAGPAQLPTYAISSFAKQIAEGERTGEDLIKIVTGNPDSARDFTDVRDVVRAYRLLVEHAEPAAYNVCSGQAVSIAEIVRMLDGETTATVEHVVDPGLVREHDVPEIRGSNELLCDETGWEPTIPLSQTIADTIAWWRKHL